MARLWEMDDAAAPAFRLSWCVLCDTFCAPFPHCLQHMRQGYCRFRLVPCDPVEEAVEEAEVA